MPSLLTHEDSVKTEAEEQSCPHLALPSVLRSLASMQTIHKQFKTIHRLHCVFLLCVNYECYHQEI